METRLRYISISHQTAPVARRERFHLSDREKIEVATAMKKGFPDLSSLMILVTCNRTELYFESAQTLANSVRDLLIQKITGSVKKEDLKDFVVSDLTEETVLHMLRVSAGLESSVMGDAEIIHQIRKAYRVSLETGMQGSLLERSMQTLFRTHKRVSNETGFRDGTTSTAYKALKLIGETFGAEAGEKKILFVGAGDIVRQLFKYNSKFRYGNLFITNRTESRASKLARAHNVDTFSWDRLIQNDLKDFDVVISAVSHTSGLIHKGLDTQKNILLIDLAVPGNFAPELGTSPSVVLHNLDSIACQLKSNRSARAAAIENVETIIAQEWSEYRQWHEMHPFRALMAGRKKQIFKALGRIGISTGHGWAENEVRGLVNQIMRKILKNPKILHNTHNLEELVAQYAPNQAA